MPASAVARPARRSRPHRRPSWTSFDRHGAASNRAAQAIIRLEAADEIFGGLIALSALLKHGSLSERQGKEPVLGRMRPVLVTLGRGIITDDPGAHVLHRSGHRRYGG